MACADEILIALGNHPAGLTCDELTEHCPSAEGDSLVIGRVISTLRANDKVTGAGGMREGRVIYKLPVATAKPQPSTAWPHQPTAAPKPAPAADSEEEETVMPNPLVKRIIAYIKEHGPTGPSALATALKDKKAKAEAKLLVKAKDLVSHGSGRGTKYGQPGQKLKAAEAAPPPEAQAVGLAPGIRRTTQRHAPSERQAARRRLRHQRPGRPRRAEGRSPHRPGPRGVRAAARLHRPHRAGVEAGLT